MYDDKKILAIIPARGGSKGLPQKNIKPLLGKPLIAWTIEAVKNSKYVDRIIISTDDKEIANICNNFGVPVPFLRPKELAKDNTPIVDVVLHLLRYLKTTENYSPGFIALCQPTSPLRTSYDMDKAFEMLFANKRADAVISITEVSENPYWMRVLADDNFIDYFLKHNYRDYRRQDLPSVYIVNGALYICKTDIFLKNKTFTPERTIGYVMPRSRSVDIDDIFDFKTTELILSEQRCRKKNE